MEKLSLSKDMCRKMLKTKIIKEKLLTFSNKFIIIEWSQK